MTTPNGGFDRESDDATPQSPYGPQGYPAPGYPPEYSQSPYPPPMPPPGQPYGPYPQPVPWAMSRPTNGMAVASMVLGILWLYWIGSILALIFGYIARRQIRERGESGNGMAIAGIVLGWVGVGVALVLLVVLLISLTAANSTTVY